MVSDGFEVSQLRQPRNLLNHAGAATFVVASGHGSVTGIVGSQKKIQVPVDIRLKSAAAQDFHGLVLPGGKESSKRLSRSADALRFVTDFMRAGKPVAAIGEALGLLFRTGMLRGRILSPTCFGEAHSKMRTNYREQELVVTAGRCNDVGAFCREMVHVLARLREHLSAAAGMGAPSLLHS